MSELVPLPATGRRFTARRGVRLGDTRPDGRLRLDALARYLQDVGDDDARDSGVTASVSWVVRRLHVELRGQAWPVFNDDVELTTWCSGTGPRWAERRTTVAGPSATIEAAAVWVAVDPASGRPVPLPPGFVDRYGEAAAGRRVSGRLSLPDPPAGAIGRPWPLRTTDLDVLGHVNNAAYWEPVEDELAPGAVPRAATMEFRLPIELATPVTLVRDDSLSVWLVGSAGLCAAARVMLRP